MSSYVLGVTFDLGFTRMFLVTIFQIYFYYHKAEWIAATAYYIYFYLIVLSPLTAIFQIKNRSINKFYILNWLLNCLVLILCLLL